MSRTRWFDIAAIALTIAALVGLAFVLPPRHTPTITVAPSAAHVDRPQAATQTWPSALFIGDSYTEGTGPAEMSYSCIAAVRMGWLCNLSGVGGTGYISGGSANRWVDPGIGPSTSFDERIPKLALMYKPDIVLLDGGRNDLFASRDAVFDAMSATIADVRQAWPAATIFLIRPRFLARPNDELGFDDEFIARLEADPAIRKVVVLDPISRLTALDTSKMMSHDGIHPNHQGDLALSSALIDSLLDHGLALRR
jgi:lysophospholipase L1-like esterase